eukprot:CAMPEP_0184323716 /NCGR_PEP_ID=MMETSP1049-20130417/131697_1 /TAXON_ID=77928 /ORGANISM="Proteomonas sulcata, Strain CCMP704" /LENGTH=301 /DNA_ID=CAMNT_0026645289 /DNA_START=170 /DNA_END=1075 /DNA_ORIENTATION=-
MQRSRRSLMQLPMIGNFDSPYDDEEEEGKITPGPLGFYRSDNGTRDSEFQGIKAKREDMNQFVEILEQLAPGEMVGQFMSTASPRVQTAVKNTIIGLLGSLRASPAFDASIITTQKALASLMFQLEMTGYMFRNAEYRVGLQKSLNQASLPPAPEEDNPTPAVKGQITVDLGDGKEVQVDAGTYVTELSREVESLKKEIANLKQSQEQEKVKDLLAYIQNLESSEMQSLTNSISQEVLDAMKQLVDSVIKGISGQADGLGPDTMTEVPASTLAQLCMWQLVVGYNLRELEARESLKKQLPE